MLDYVVIKDLNCPKCNKKIEIRKVTYPFRDGWAHSYGCPYCNYTLGEVKANETDDIEVVKK